MSNDSWYASNQAGWYGGGSNNWSAEGAGYDIPDAPQDDANAANFNNFYGGGTPAKRNDFSSAQQPLHTGSGFYSNAGVGMGMGTQRAPTRPDPIQPNLPNMFLPNTGNFGSDSRGGANGFDDMDNEPPLLEELGVNFDHIVQKTLAVLNPMRHADPSVIHDNDLAGPLVFCLMFGFSLLLHGKVHFGIIYGIGALGCVGVYLLLNAMSTCGITLTCTMSVLGYCLLPMGLLSLLAAVLSFKGVIGLGVAGAAVLWCSVSASKLFVTALSMDSQRLLVAYPCSLLYGVFALLAIF